MRKPTPSLLRRTHVTEMQVLQKQVAAAEVRCLRLRLRPAPPHARAC